MGLYFENVRLLSYNHAPQILGAGLRFRIQKQFQIEGTFLQRNQYIDGSTNILNKEKLVLDTAQDYQEIYLNNVLFGRGKITRVSFEGGNHVRKENYTYEIICFEDGDLFNLATVHAGINWDNAELWDGISESFSYDEDEEGNKSYNHQVSVRIEKQLTPNIALSLAKALAQNFLSSVSGVIGFLGQYANLGNAQKLYSETQNLSDGTYSVNESVSIKANSAGNYSYSLTYNIEIDEIGYVTIEETVSIDGNTNPKMAGAEEGYIALKNGAYTRSNIVYASYNLSDANLFSLSLKLGVSRNKFSGNIQFTNSFTNNPKYHNFAIWEYQIEYNQDQLGIVTLRENGTVLGIGRPVLSKFKAAKTFYDTLEVNILSRLAALYLSQGGVKPLNTIAKSFEKDEFKGEINYSLEQTDDPLYNVEDPFKKIETNIVLSPPVHLIQKYNIFNYKEIVQTQRQSTLGTKEIQLKIRAKRGTLISVFLVKAKSLINGLKPVQTDTFLVDCPYNFDPKSAEFTITAKYSYPGDYKELNDLRPI